MYKILKNVIEMDDYSVQKLSKSQSEPFEWNTVEGTELNVSDCIGGKGKIAVKGNTYQKSRILPEGYTQVDYIQSHGREYIDTGINADSNLRTILDMTYDSVTDANQTIGSIYLASGVEIRYHVLIQNGYFRIYLQDTSNAFNTIEADTNRHYYDIDVPNQTVLVDDNTYNINILNFNTNLNFWLFGRNSTSSLYKCKNKLYKCKMYVSGVLVRDFIPCYRNSDNEVGLYDLVNNVFYTNDGNDAFTYGSVVDIPNPEYPQEIKVVTGNNVIKNCGKNLFDKDNANIINTGLSSKVISTSEYNRLLYIPVKSSTTYTIQRRNDGDVNRFRVGSCTVIPANNVSVPNAIENDNATNITITTGVNDKYLAVMYYRTYETVLAEQQILDSIQIEEGTTPTPYEPYKEKNYNLNLGTIELCKIGDYQDILFKNIVGDENYNAELESGAWYKKNVINKNILNGTRRFSSAGIANVYYTPSISDYSRNNNKPFCDYFSGFDNVPSAASINKINLIGFNNTYDYNRCYISFNGTVEELLAFLTEKEPIIYYANDNPTYTKITDTTLISQLEALNKARWFKGVNHWWTETDNLEPVLKGTYRQAVESEVP